MNAFSPHPNTEAEYDRVIDEARSQSVVARIAACLQESGSGASWYVLGAGKQTASLQRELGKIDGARVLWKMSALPSILAPLRLVVASYRYLVEVTKPAALTSVFRFLSHQSMAGIYAIRTLDAPAFELAVRHGRLDAAQDFGVKADPSYFIYIVDADSMEAATGIVELVSYGTQASGCLRRCLELE